MQPPPPDYCLFWINHWSTCMTRAEWSGWVQAVGSIVAILAGAGFVLFQHRLELRRQHMAERARVISRVAVFEEVARATAHHVGVLQAQLTSREKIYAIAQGRTRFDHDGLTRLNEPLASLHLADLEDPKIVNGVMILSANVRQFRDLVLVGIQHARELDAPQYAELIKSLSECSAACKQTAEGIKAKRVALENEISRTAASA